MLYLNYSYALFGLKLCFRWAIAMLYLGLSYACVLCQVMTGALSPYGSRLSSS